jgi:hypothetical protein
VRSIGAKVTINFVVPFPTPILANCAKGSEDDQHLWHECSRLITNCIIFYNMTLLSQLWARKEATQDMTHIAHISPVAWQHINFYGRYEFTKVSELINMEEIVEALALHPTLSLADEGDTY